MTLKIPVRPDVEARFRSEAAHAGLPVEQLAARRLEEAELLWRIRSAAPRTETRELHRLLRKRNAGMLVATERERLVVLLDERELRAAQRLEDLARLSQLSGISLRSLMDRLGIAPVRSP